VLGRLDFVADIKSRILGTTTPDHSFAIGIIGQWGTGKTTFLNALEKVLSSEEGVIQLRFNPWITKSPEGITALFFSDLAARLSRYDDGLRKDVLSYSKDLVHAVDNNGLSLVKTLFSLTAQENDLQEKHQVINDSIRRLNRKLIIYIDDVDRLEKSEVVEVLRIIRNTADFSNTFFVVAFDRVYATTSINAALVGDSTSYLEKIFQLEYYLPLHPNRKVFVSSLFTELRKFLDEKGKTVLAKIESPDDHFFHLEVVPPLSSYIHSFRDVNRYMNVFLLYYERIKNNIYLPDFLSMCLLRLKFPEIYQLLFFEKYRFLTSDHEYGIFEKDYGSLTLRFLSKKERTVEQTQLYLELRENTARYAITNGQVLEAAILVYNIFAPGNNTDMTNYKRTLPNHHLTITDASCFDRYFDFSMQGRLDQAAFEAALNQPIAQLEKFIEECNQSRSMSTDLQIKLENFKTFESRNTFEKVIIAIVHYANQPAPGNSDHPNSFNTDIFYAKLGGNDTVNNQVIHSVYRGDKEAFRKFLRAFITITCRQVNGFFYLNLSVS
jgi:predicted KAP-like P-loop ATPase